LCVEGVDGGGVLSWETSAGEVVEFWGAAQAEEAVGDRAGHGGVSEGLEEGGVAVDGGLCELGDTVVVAAKGSADEGGGLFGEADVGVGEELEDFRCGGGVEEEVEELRLEVVQGEADCGGSREKGVVRA
jgi:hypothetical protein